jgi:hypothetical protein
MDGAELMGSMIGFCHKQTDFASLSGVGVLATGWNPLFLQKPNPSLQPWLLARVLRLRFLHLRNLRLNLKTEMAEGESAAVIGPTRLPASRVASSYRCNRCELGSLVEPSTTPSSSLSIPVSRVKWRFRGGMDRYPCKERGFSEGSSGRSLVG